MKKHIIPLLAIVVIVCLLLFIENDFLWMVQEQNLFLCTGLFFKEQMVLPGGLLTWLGTFFTQFLYYPWLGMLLLAAWWMLLVWLIGRTFQLSSLFSYMVTIIPVLLILTTIVDMGYWVYILKLHGHFFITTIGATVVTALLWGFRVQSSKFTVHSSQFTPLISNLLFIICTAAIGYPLIGIYGLAAALLMSIWIWRLEPQRWRALAISVTGLLSIVIVPLLCYRHVYYQIHLDNIYFAELPLYFITEEYHQYYIPFYLLLLFFVLMTICPPKVFAQRPSSHLSPLTSHLPTLIFLVLLAGTIVYTAKNWNRDENFHHELAMQRSMEQLDWEGILREATTQEDEPTRTIVIMRNIALARLGRQGDEMYRYPNGSKRYDAPFDMRMMLVNGPQIYYHYGMANNCNRLCTEMGVEFGWRAWNLKYMARCAILNGEWQLARKFIGLLKDTFFFNDCADSLAKLIEKPDAIASSPDMGFITHMMHYKSEMTSDQGYVEEFIIKHLAASTYADDPIFQEQALMASLFTRNSQQFWRHLANYTKLHNGKPLPKHVQEAAILIGTLEERPGIESWPIDNSVRESFRRFQEITPRFDNMEVGPVRKALAPMFGHTYFYEYYLMNNLPQY